MKLLSIDVPEESASKAINLVSLRKGDLLVMEPKGDLQHLEFTIPSRGLIGLRNRILTATAGTAIINHRFSEYGPFKGEFSEDIKGAIVSSAAGKATAYAIDRLQDRGRFFIDINEEIYIGQVVGENSKDSDMGVNLIKGKQLTNMRKSGTDDAMKIAPKVDFSLEECMEYIKVDEYLELLQLVCECEKFHLDHKNFILFNDFLESSKNLSFSILIVFSGNFEIIS